MISLFALLCSGVLLSVSSYDGNEVSAGFETISNGPRLLMEYRRPYRGSSLHRDFPHAHRISAMQQKANALRWQETNELRLAMSHNALMNQMEGGESGDDDKWSPGVGGSLASLESELNRVAKDKWNYVGGYAAHLHAPTIGFDDLDIAVSMDCAAAAQFALYGVAGAAEQLPKVSIGGGSHEVSIIPVAQYNVHIDVVGNARVLKADEIARNYLQLLEIKYGLVKLVKNRRDASQTKSSVLAKMRVKAETFDGDGGHSGGIEKDIKRIQRVWLLVPAKAPNDG